MISRKDDIAEGSERSRKHLISIIYINNTDFSKMRRESADKLESEICEKIDWIIHKFLEVNFMHLSLVMKKKRKINLKEERNLWEKKLNLKNIRMLRRTRDLYNNSSKPCVEYYQQVWRLLVLVWVEEYYFLVTYIKKRK